MASRKKLDQKNAKKMAGVDSDLKDFFEELIDETEVPPATHLMIELIGIGFCTREQAE
jgi:hypothetical protein